MTDSQADSVAEALPARVPLSNQAISTALRLWREGEGCDRGTLERVAAGLRDLDTHPCTYMPRAQHEIDGIIARWRAAHPADTGDAS